MLAVQHQQLGISLAAKAKQLVAQGVAATVAKDVAKFGLLGVIAGSAFTAAVTYLMFKTASAQRAWAPALVAGVGSAIAGTGFVLVTRKAVGDYPRSMDAPFDQKITALKPVWFGVGLQTSR